ncbi:MAG: metalloregulator ArsR/SmtB family transcription factor [Acidimicrobiia bacterium]|nr:metalloregulator ArsR/SmtB family transcription factor [Acidimicrobiia bacterium]
MTTDQRSAIPVAVEACCPPISVPLSEDQAGELAKVFAALADPVRLRLLSLVASRDEVCSCDLQGPLGRSQPTVSHHTKALAEAGLIVGEKRGRWTWWRAVPERLEALRGALR